MLKEISSIKISKVTVLKLMVLSLLGVWSLSFEVSSAQERGIGVSPAEINVEQVADWPYTTLLTVTNFSAEQSRFEVFDAQARPGRFSLEAGASRRVLLTFDPPAGGPAEGVVRVLSMRTSAQGLSTGTGVKIPFRIQSSDNSRFLASARESTGEFPYIFGAGVILASLVLLWQIAGIIRPWLANSNKQ